VLPLAKLNPDPADKVEEVAEAAAVVVVPPKLNPVAFAEEVAGLAKLKPPPAVVAPPSKGLGAAAEVAGALKKPAPVEGAAAPLNSPPVGAVEAGVEDPPPKLNEKLLAVEAGCCGVDCCGAAAVCCVAPVEPKLKPPAAGAAAVVAAGVLPNENPLPLDPVPKLNPDMFTQLE